MNIGTIAGGTHAGWRVVRPAHKTWTCQCAYLKDGGFFRVNPGYLSKCTCGNPRPN